MNTKCWCDFPPGPSGVHEDACQEIAYLTAEVTQFRRERDVARCIISKQDTEVLAIVERIPVSMRVRVRENNGPENIYASLAVSVAKMAAALAEVRQ